MVCADAMEARAASAVRRLLVEFPGGVPVVVEEGVHRFCKAGVLEDDGGPGGTGEDGIEESDQADAVVEDGELHGKVGGLADFEAGFSELVEALAVRSVEGALLNDEAAFYAALEGLFDEAFVEGVDGVGRLGELDVFFADVLEHFAVVVGGLAGIGDDAEIVKRATAALSGSVGSGEFVGESESVERLLFDLLLERGFAAGEIASEGESGFDGAEELGAFLDDAGEAFVDEGVEDFVDFLSGNLSAGSELQCFESRVAEQYQIGAGFVGVEANLLQAAPVALIFSPWEF